MEASLQIPKITIEQPIDHAIKLLFPGRSLDLIQDH
jgi:hypothetical protein